jgi:hypothetical protein
MSRWIETERGDYVNLDHVRRIRRTPGKHGGHHLRLELTDNTETQTCERDWDPMELDEMLAIVLPAAPGQEALLVADDTHERPTEIWITRHPIVGWRIRCHPNFLAAEPVLPTSLGGGRRMVVLPDGRLLENFVGEYANIDAMKTKLLAEAQEDWDRAHAQQAAQ